MSHIVLWFLHSSSVSDRRSLDTLYKNAAITNPSSALVQISIKQLNTICVWMWKVTDACIALSKIQVWNGKDFSIVFKMDESKSETVSHEAYFFMHVSTISPHRMRDFRIYTNSLIGSSKSSREILSQIQMFVSLLSFGWKKNNHRYEYDDWYTWN